MNHCAFLGKIISKNLTELNDVEKIELVLQVENKRKVKKDVKKMDYEYLSFEAWGSAAISIEKNLTIDDYMLIIDSTARADSGIVCFRINEFKIIKKGN